MRIKRTALEVVRHLILKAGLAGTYIKLRTATGRNVEHLGSKTLGERFSTIYRNRIWLNGRASGSLSGMGSEIENTKGIRSKLPALLATLHTRTLLDVGCGDFNWMRELNIGCQYIGVDIAKHIIDLNIQKHAAANRTFCALDATRDPLPAADTVLCREVLFHLSFEHIEALIRNVRTSGISVLIATTDVCTSFNADILSGDFRLLNLTKPPFRFPQPELRIPDEEVSPGRMLGVWDVSRLRFASQGSRPTNAMAMTKGI